jgi:hypothetical protein
MRASCAPNFHFLSQLHTANADDAPMKAIGKVVGREQQMHGQEWERWFDVLQSISCHIGANGCLPLARSVVRL